MDEQDLLDILHVSANDLKTQYNLKQGFLEDDRDDYFYYTGMIDGINNLLLQFYHDLWKKRSERLD